MRFDGAAEWLEADGLGGFASGTASGIRTRRYHALLLTAATPPTGRLVLVNGVEAWIDRPGGSLALTSHQYAPGIVHPDGASRIAGFAHEPWPTWTFEAGDVRLCHELVVEHGTGLVVLQWTLDAASESVALRVRPFLSGRDYHATHHENGAFRFDAAVDEGQVTFRPYDGIPAVVALTNGRYRHAPDWYRSFLYVAERERGLDATEDLGSPGEFAWTLSPGDRAVLVLGAGGIHGAAPALPPPGALDVASRVVAAERRRREALPTPLDRAADAYLVRRGAGRTIVAGYPWFTDWGRDTFIAVRGLCLATGRLNDARDVLLQWADAVSEGMLPNRFTDSGEQAEYNSVDASLWYVVAVSELLAVSRRGTLTPEQRQALEIALLDIVSGYAGGTRFGIRMDDDGLLAAGVPGVQLTWMDARVGERVITPRAGKPVEIQALWLNALAAASRVDHQWLEPLQRGRRAFADRFWNDATGMLADVIDVDHVPGTRDDTCRPNQILAVGGLPMALVDGDRAKRLVLAVEQRLLTPIGLRSLAPGEPGYASKYEGGPPERDAVYHQGTVWPWLMGPFVEAWVRVHGESAQAKRHARRRFVEPLLAHLHEAGLGHISEIADAEPPHTPRGCPFQAWSLGELLRLDRVVLADRTRPSTGVHRGPSRTFAEPR